MIASEVEPSIVCLKFGYIELLHCTIQGSIFVYLFRHLSLQLQGYNNFDKQI